ncbi:MAG: Elongation factor 4 [Parcubacteria group bacterium GW2011_GWA2_47_21]|nr:MAG: Elongation factor 4 [Parcubacteria group bacterium GW2011_GWA2_47_21]
MGLENIRNFCVIAHIDHGKSTLADRFLELTGTIEKRKMQDQVLDSMELERERGITIKMKPVRMIYKGNHAENLSSKSKILNKSQYSNPNFPKSLEIRVSSLGFAGSEFILNLIDTPGHIDFSYEVSRALKAVEGAILLVDATQGVQAQTLSVLQMAREQGLAIIPAVNKIDSPLARVVDVKADMAKLLHVAEGEIMEVSGRTGQGVPELLEEIIGKVPPPKQTGENFQALIFDFQYSNHTGVILYLRVMAGEVNKRDALRLIAGKARFIPIDLGVFSPKEMPTETLSAGEIGYIITGIKEPGIATVGDTVTSDKNPALALPGYGKPAPVVWASVYPESQDDFNALRQALARLRLSDSSFAYEEESSGVLGRGFRVGFLGMLHLEIITERLRREFGLKIIVTTPSISYEVTDRAGRQKIAYSPIHFPDHGEVVSVREPWAAVQIIAPADYLGNVMQLFYEHEAVVGVTENLSDNRTEVEARMPLRELMRNFFDELKSATSGYGSLSYKIQGEEMADVVKMEILVAGESVPAFARIVSRRRLETEAEASVEKLHKILPRQMFATKIQAKALGRIISSRTLSALRKDVTGYLYGGDITRKRKLWEKQKEGKKRLKERGKVNIPEEVFVKMMRQ